MKRSEPLRRKTYLRARSKMSSYRRRPRDLDRMRWCRRQPCCARDLGGCSGRVQADHAGRRGIGQKALDNTVIPMCETHHACRDAFNGVFKKWNQSKMRAWLIEKIAYYQMLYERRLAREKRCV